MWTSRWQSRAINTIFLTLPCKIYEKTNTKHSLVTLIDLTSELLIGFTVLST